MDLRNSSKLEGDGHIFESCDIYFSQNMPASHAVSLALLLFACHFCHALAYAITAKGASFVC